MSTADLIAKAREWAASFKGTKGAERLNSVYYITALADALEPRTITTLEELTELLEDEDRSVVLADVGGYVWWSTYTSAAGNVLTGCACPSDAGITTGQTVDGWMNVMRPYQAIGYGPFTVLRDSNDEQP